VIVEPTYRGFRIEVGPSPPGMVYWNAHVRILRLFSREKPRRESVTCHKITAEHAEGAAIVVAKRWINANGDKKAGA